MDIREKFYEIKEKIHKSLEYEWDGNTGSMYSSFYIFGASREDIENALTEMKLKGFFFDNGIGGQIDLSNEAIFSFMAWKEIPLIVKTMSRLLPNHLCVGEMDWDNYDIKIYKNDHIAKKNIDYTFNLIYQNYPDMEDEEEEYYEIDYIITDLVTGESIQSNGGMIYKEDLEAILHLTTSYRYKEEELEREE